MQHRLAFELNLLGLSWLDKKCAKKEHVVDLEFYVLGATIISLDCKCLGRHRN